MLFDMNIPLRKMSYVQNCRLIGDAENEPIFLQLETGEVLARLDGYTIMKNAEYDRLMNTISTLNKDTTSNG